MSWQDLWFPYLLVGSNDDPDAVVVADRPGTGPTVALCGARHGGNTVKRLIAQRSLIGLRRQGNQNPRFRFGALYNGVDERVLPSISRQACGTSMLVK